MHRVCSTPLGGELSSSLDRRRKERPGLAATVDIADLLWETGVRPIKGIWGTEPIDAAFEDDRFDVAVFFLEKLPPGPKRQEVVDAELGRFSGTWMNPEAVRLILLQGANVNASHSLFGTPLHAACWQGDGNGGRETSVVRETLEHLIQAGADLNARDSCGNTPLHEAAVGDWGAPTSVEVRLAHGAEVDPVNAREHTPLMLAAAHGEFECIQLLLQSGANPVPARPEARRWLESWRSIVLKGRTSGSLEPRHQETLAQAEETVRLLNA